MAGEITNIKVYYGDTLEKIARRHFKSYCKTKRT